MQIYFLNSECAVQAVHTKKLHDSYFSIKQLIQGFFFFYLNSHLNESMYSYTNLFEQTLQYFGWHMYLEEEYMILDEHDNSTNTCVSI